MGEDGQSVLLPTKIPYYKPEVYPLVLQRNVSLFGQLLGDSDADKIADQQNTVNRLPDPGLRLPRILHVHAIPPLDGGLGLGQLEDDVVHLLDAAGNVRNIVAENIESQVSTDIPQPKVTARRKQDEGLARLIEDMLRNELEIY